MKFARILLLGICLGGLVLSLVLERHEANSLKKWDQPNPEKVKALDYVEACTWDAYLVANERLWIRDSLQNLPSEVKACPT